MNNSEYRQPTHREELERELVHGASSQIAHAPENAAAIAKGIKTVLDELAPKMASGIVIPPIGAPSAGTTAASLPLPVVDPGPDALERAWEYKTYQDGTTAFGPAPLPDVSPALWAKPLAKEVPELTESLSDLGLEREIQANSHHSGCKGERCMASAANGYAHSRECIDEAGEAQGWTPTAEDYAKCGPSACASPENFDAEIGRKIARKNAIEKIWPLVGYELRTKLAGSKA